MKVVLLCGGKGTRLRELTEDIPKPLVEIGGKPILWHIMKTYSHHGYNDFILCLGYKGEKIKEYFKDSPWNISFVDTGLDANKSSRLKQIESLIDSDKFLLAYGDDVSDVNISEVVDKHKAHGKMVTLTAIPLQSNFGILDMNDDNHVTNFKEKPKLDHWFNGGFFVMNKEIFNHLDKGELEKEVFEHLASLNQIVAHKHDGFWKCMNTFKDTQELNEMWEKGEAVWKVWD